MEMLILISLYMKTCSIALCLVFANPVQIKTITYIITTAHAWIWHIAIINGRSDYKNSFLLPN